MADARRSWLLVVLLALYLASGLRSVIADRFRRSAFDPFLPAARALEQRLAEARFAEALPLAVDLDRAYPQQAQVALWLARIHHGLKDPVREAAAWEQYAERSPAPEEACPALPDAYARAGRDAEARAARQRCSAFDEKDSLRGAGEER